MKLKEINYEKEEIEKLKKYRNRNKISKKSSLPSVPTDGFVSSQSLSRMNSG